MGFLSALFGDPPTPPNPLVTATAQQASNFGTAIASGYINNTNQVTPTGNLTYTANYDAGYRDPISGYTVPQWTATQTLTPQGQAANTANQNTALNLANMGEAESARLQKLLGTSFDPNFNWRSYLAANPDIAATINSWPGQQGNEEANAYAARLWYDTLGRYDPNTRGVAPSAADYRDLSGFDARTGFADVGGPQRSLGPYAGQVTGFGDAGAIARGYGPADNFSADRQRVEQSMYERMNPQMLQDEERVRQQLRDQGIQPGTEAYDRAYDAMTRQRTDARLAITSAGGQEQQRMMDMAAQEAGFQNAAQKQAYDQLLGRATFTNQAQLEQFQKDLQAGNFANEAQKNAFTQEASRAQFFNAGQAQNLANKKTVFDAQNAQRAQYLNESYAQRQQPINEISALQSGSQVSQPNFVNTAQGSIANTDIAGIINNNFSQNLDIYKQNSNNLNNIIGGLFGLAGAGVKASDRRVKKNVAKLGNVYAAKRHDEPKKLPIYAYEYKNDPASARHIGPMAQDVEKIDPGAVETIRGVKHLRKQRVMGDILRVA